MTEAIGNTSVIIPTINKRGGIGMQRIGIGSLFILALLCIAHAAAFGDTQYEFTIDCAEGSVLKQAIVVVTYDDDGRVLRCTGVHCDGTLFNIECPGQTEQGDPYPSDPGYNYHNLGSGAWIKVNVSTSGVVTQLWGYDLNGDYWEQPQSCSGGSLSTSDRMTMEAGS